MCGQQVPVRGEMDGMCVCRMNLGFTASLTRPLNLRIMNTLVTAPQGLSCGTPSWMAPSYNCAAECVFTCMKKCSAVCPCSLALLLLLLLRSLTMIAAVYRMEIWLRILDSVGIMSAT